MWILILFMFQGTVQPSGQMIAYPSREGCELAGKYATGSEISGGFGLTRNPNLGYTCVPNYNAVDELKKTN